MAENAQEGMGEIQNMNDRIGDWFLTYSGIKFYPLSPRPSDILIVDIAHALSQVCRFGGHCRETYSVGQHCILVSQLLATRYENPVQFQGLMHDSAEAYLGDMVRPLKRSMPDYRLCEDVVWEAICEAFGMETEMIPAIKWADNTLLMTERRDVCMPSDYPWSLAKDFPPMKEKIVPLPPQQVESDFLALFRKLSK